MNANGVRLVPHLTMRDVHDIIGIIVHNYNTHYAHKLQALTSAKFVKFFNTDGGSRAVLVRKHYGDEVVQIYKSPQGITRADSYYGHILGACEEVTYNNVLVRTNFDIEEIRRRIYH